MKPVIQMRVEPEEKARLLAEAKAEGITLSDLLRRRILGNEAKAASAVTIHARATGKTTTTVVDDLEHFRQRVNYFKNAHGMTTKRAEEAARQECA